MNFNTLIRILLILKSFVSIFPINTMENNFSRLPNEIVDLIFNNLSYQDQKALLCVDKRLSKFKEFIERTYLSSFNKLPMNVLSKIFIEEFEILEPKPRRIAFSINRHFAKLAFETMWWKENEFRLDFKNYYMLICKKTNKKEEKPENPTKILTKKLEYAANRGRCTIPESTPAGNGRRRASSCRGNR